MLLHFPARSSPHLSRRTVTLTSPFQQNGEDRTIPATKMKLKRRIKGGIVAFIGFMLSPLSWWNDLVVNVPLALAFAWIVSWFLPSLFTVIFIVGYWLTNVLGFVLMHK